MGLPLPHAARLAFLMAIPTILLAFGYELFHFHGAIDAPPLPLLVGFFVSFVTAWICIEAFCRFVEKIGLYPFVVYRFTLGSILLFLL
jgi:undecaprenyl-diphosphatase